MTLDTKALSYDFTLFGDAIPRYQLTPDGKALLVPDVERLERLVNEVRQQS